jgi:hypothetical protein
MKNRARLSLADLPHRVRATLAAWQERWRESRADLRPTPERVRAALMRIGLPVLAILALVAAVRWLTTLAQPGGRAVSEEATPTATLFVACTDAGCRAEYTVQRARDFEDWPLTCERCGRAAVERATLCRQCRGWYAGSQACPHCAARAAGAQSTTAPAPHKRADDAEDPW